MMLHHYWPIQRGLTHHFRHLREQQVVYLFWSRRFQSCLQPIQMAGETGELRAITFHAAVWARCAGCWVSLGTWSCLMSCSSCTLATLRTFRRPFGRLPSKSVAGIFYCCGAPKLSDFVSWGAQHKMMSFRCAGRLIRARIASWEEFWILPDPGTFAAFSFFQISSRDCFSHEFF